MNEFYFDFSTIHHYFFFTFCIDTRVYAKILGIKTAPKERIYSFCKKRKKKKIIINYKQESEKAKANNFELLV